MSGFYGADTAQLRDYGDLLNTGNRQLSELASQLASQVNSVEWVGADAEAFRSDFSGRVNGLFDSAQGLMDRYRQDIGVHAEEQDEVSTPDGGGALDAIGDAIGNFLGEAIGTIADVGQGIFDVLTSTGMGVLSGIAGTTLDIIELVDDTFPKGWGKGVGVFGALTGAYQIYDNWGDGSPEGVLNQIAGGLSVVSGVAAFIPGGQVVSAIAGAAALGINGGLWIAENWDSITSTVSGAVNFMGDLGAGAWDLAGDVGGAAVDFAGDVGDAAVDFAGDVADGVGDFVSGLF